MAEEIKTTNDEGCIACEFAKEAQSVAHEKDCRCWANGVIFGIAEATAHHVAKQADPMRSLRLCIPCTMQLAQEFIHMQHDPDKRRALVAGFAAAKTPVAENVKPSAKPDPNAN